MRRRASSVEAAAETDTLVVGAGPQALTVLARWLCDRPASVQHITVVDPAGTWMQAWRRGFEQQRIDVLRSPGVHHPDPDDMAYVHAHPQRQSFEASCSAPLAGTVGPLRRPTAAAFWRFCQDLLDRTGLSDRVVEASVVALRPSLDPHAGDRWVGRLSTGATVRSRQVVWAGNPRAVRTPPGVTLGGAVVHSHDVDLDVVRAGERIAVLGGGQTAGQLALRAAQRGAVVTLISRGAKRIADLDVDAGWLMDDHLAPFSSIRDPVERRRVVEQIHCGSMTADLDRELRRAHVLRVTDAGELAAWTDERGPVVSFADVECPVDRVWAATGSVPDLRAAPALAGLADAGAPHVGGWPVLDGQLQWCEGLSVIGALAALTLGPAAGNLGGARAAADLLAGRIPTGEANAIGASW